MSTFLTLSLISSVYMCGVIWVIQLIHYPSFSSIVPNQFLQFHSQHTMAMGLIVGPVMVIELVAGLWLLMNKAEFFSVSYFIMVATLWALTFFVSVPLHNKLAQGYDLQVIQNLISTNWPRTIIWTAKAILTSVWSIRIFQT